MCSYVQKVEKLIVFHNIMNIYVYEQEMSFISNVKGDQLNMNRCNSLFMFCSIFFKIRTLIDFLNIKYVWQLIFLFI